MNEEKWAALQNKLDAIEKKLTALEGKLDGIRDGLADEIAGLRRAVQVLVDGV